MAVDFPSSPTLNQTYTYLGKTWQWDGLGWKLYSIAVSGGASVVTSDTAPTSPNDGDLWYDSVSGRTYIYYDDGTTSQWVDAAPASGFVNPIVDANISATAEIAVSKLADGSARQLLQTDAAGTGVEWTSNVDIPGTLDVTGVSIFDNNIGVGTSPDFSWWSENAQGIHIKAVSANESSVLRLSSNSGSSLYINGPADSSPDVGFWVDPGNSFYFGNSYTRLIITDGDGYLRLTSVGGGIQFNGDTSSANALDDYEEGTFTPVVKGDTTAGTASYIGQSGRYTKIGRVVQFEIDITWTGGTGSGNLLIDGLPFVSADAETYPSVCIGWFNNITLDTNKFPLAYVENNTTSIALTHSPIGGGNAGYVSYDSSGGLTLSGSYSI